MAACLCLGLYIRHNDDLDGGLDTRRRESKGELGRREPQCEESGPRAVVLGGLRPQGETGHCQCVAGSQNTLFY